ncbi:MAG TPA: tryptophan--tRNA ligase, partial [Caulobacteraceae bacterium]|nr:tryptophan--tRNA ligase [Caulobacteraceae bacterium]
IRKARTDADPLPETVDGLAGRHEADNLVGLFAALSGRSKADVLAEYAGQGFGQSFKPALAELVIEQLRPVAEGMRSLAADPAHVDRVLAAGAEKARTLADPVLAEAKDLVGFWRARA